MDAKHTPDGDRSFRDSVMRHAGAGVALVVGTAMLFWVIAVAGSRDGGDGVAVTPPTQTPASSPSEPGPAATNDVPTTPAVPTDPATSTPEPTSDPPAGQQIDPSTISVQVIDAVLNDGGAAADRVASRLSGAGYQVRFRPTSVRVHDTTKLWYTAGNQAAAEQLRAFLGVGTVEPAPSHITASVSVHVVVGRDA